MTAGRTIQPWQLKQLRYLVLMAHYERALPSRKFADPDDPSGRRRLPSKRYLYSIECESESPPTCETFRWAADAIRFVAVDHLNHRTTVAPVAERDRYEPSKVKRDEAAIIEAIGSRRLTIREIAESTGIGFPTLRRRLRGMIGICADERPGAATVYGLRYEPVP